VVVVAAVPALLLQLQIENQSAEKQRPYLGWNVTPAVPGKSAPAGGFLLHSTSHVVLRRCVAIGNRNASGPAPDEGLAAGFLASTVLADMRGERVGGVANAFIDCVADGNSVERVPLFVQAPAPAVDAGPIRGDPRKGAGFLLDRQRDPRVVGCQALNNRGRGLWLRGCAGALVEDNLLAGNSGGGLHDEAPAGPNVHVHNRARVNGDGPDYAGLPAATPVRAWTLGTVADEHSGSPFENTSISVP